ncbi:chalcone isomerase family protein [Aliiglaciecola sp. CAU 1673]|uniref:chalcone isomerase family protein n=1 Tax=Aliiglaciecola sp. CAU 1673 TaxID=3032595 RepID=UPI0023D9D7F9|nr:chalcone isomerase family protein [Aliiglaciecola sp. CAU 1673]MDF2178212.1 chalcone isomerase family protein [Aliiglaciecola sp. CAU 1673]
MKKALLSLMLLAATMPLMASVMSSRALSDLQLVGQAKLNVLFWEIYHSSLYSVDGEYQPGHYPIALRIQYLRDIDAQELVDATRDEWKKQGLSEDQFSSWLTTLATIWPDIQDGDVLLLRVDEQVHSHFYHNSKPVGEIDDPDFGPAFLNIWLSEKASYPKLRAQLIGKEDE